VEEPALPACRQGADGRILAQASAGKGAAPATGPHRWRRGRSSREWRGRSKGHRPSHDSKPIEDGDPRRACGARDRRLNRAALGSGRDRHPARGRDARPFRPAARSRGLKRDRARPPEDEGVRGRARPGLTPDNARRRLHNPDSSGSAFILPEESDLKKVSRTVLPRFKKGGVCFRWFGRPCHAGWERRC
jgi:hypothetical protein